jgi:hypothetical protein
LISLPLLAWRGVTLAWALWLAWSVIAWLRWGWQAFNAGGLWRKKEKPPGPGALPEDAVVGETRT